MRTPRIDLKALASRSARVVALRRRLQSGEAQHWTTRFGASGVPQQKSTDGLHPDSFSIERIRVKSPGGRNVIVRFQFDHKPNDYEIDDVAGCLARIFENASLKGAQTARPPASVDTSDLRTEKGLPDSAKATSG